MKLMFCMFAEDIELLPRELFTSTVTNARDKPAQLSKLLKNLFESMAKGEPFGADTIAWFNGGLFADSETIDLTPDEIAEMLKAARCDWSSVEPTIFGTLFERTLDPAKRSQIGAHYTSREDIETLLRPVMLAPLRREWEETRDRANKLWEKIQAEGGEGRGSAQEPDRFQGPPRLRQMPARFRRPPDPRQGPRSGVRLGQFPLCRHSSAPGPRKGSADLRRGTRPRPACLGVASPTSRAGNQSVRRPVGPGRAVDRVFAMDAIQRHSAEA